MNNIDIPSIYSIQQGVDSFTGIIIRGEYVNWIVSVDVYSDTHGRGKNQSTIKTYEANFAPTTDSKSGITQPLNESVFITDKLDELLDHLSHFEINWLNENDSLRAYGRLWP